MQRIRVELGRARLPALAVFTALLVLTGVTTAIDGRVVCDGSIGSVAASANWATSAGLDVVTWIGDVNGLAGR